MQTLDHFKAAGVGFKDLQPALDAMHKYRAKGWKKSDRDISVQKITNRMKELNDKVQLCFESLTVARSANNVAEHFGVNRTTAQNWLNILIIELRISVSMHSRPKLYFRRNL
jgi:response regulator of citrate/malate metabolism